MVWANVAKVSREKRLNSYGPKWANHDTRTTSITTASNFTGICRGAEGSSRFLPPPVVHPNFTSVIPAPLVAPGPAPMDVDTAKWQFGAPLTCRHCGKVGHCAWECPQAYNVCYMMVDEYEELVHSLSSHFIKALSMAIALYLCVL